MIRLRDPWQRPHHPARPLLLFRGICMLLSFDAWTLMLEHGGRYGVGDFNVAHFDFLDALLPLPGPALYLALVTGVGLYALLGAVGMLTRAEAILLWGLYTLAWSLSIHDSYQHHYLLSWLLGFSIFAPVLSIRDCLRPEDRISESSFPLVLACCAIVYLFTAISKSAPLWRSGAVLRRLAKDGGPMSWTPELLLQLGVASDKAWHFAALSVLALQLVIASGLVAAAYRDASESRVLASLTTLALIAATSFHVATELSPSFAIGWFSYYMLWTVWICLLPAAWLARTLSLVERKFARWRTLRVTDRTFIASACASLSTAIVFWWFEDLPGVGVAAPLFCLSLLLRSHRIAQDDARRTLLAIFPLFALSALTLTLSVGHVRFDYYRRAAGELSRMGRTVDALALYRKAELHAPAGASRRARIEELEKRLGEHVEE